MELSDVAPQGSALSSLLNSELGDRFYSWQGASRAKYICAVFQDCDEVALSDFEGAVIIAVARHKGGVRPVRIFQPADFRPPAGPPRLQATVKLLGAIIK